MKVSHQLDAEAVHPNYLQEGLLSARQKTLQLFSEIRRNLREGMNEPEARKLAIEAANNLGTKKHWHQPYIRFGKGTALSFHEPLREENIFFNNIPVSIDLGPVWTDGQTALEYEGDFGDSFVVGKNPEAERCIHWTRALFSEAKNKWKSEHISGIELYRYLRKRCEELGYILAEDFDGHRLSDFPHQKYTKDRLATLPFVPTNNCWILELQVKDPEGRFGAFYEDLL